MYRNKVFAGEDTIAAFYHPVQLNANGGRIITTPGAFLTGLSDMHIEDPVAVYDKEQCYRLDGVTNEGCDAGQ